MGGDLLLILLMSSAISVAAGSSATFDLYLDTAEVNTLLGVSSRLYYVMDGDVKRNAAKVALPVADDVDRAHFVWKADGTVDYSVRVTRTHHEFSAQPSINVSHSGAVPDGRPEVWRVTLPCLEDGAAGTRVEVRFDVELTFKVGGEEDRVLNVSRTKFCGGGDAGSAAGDGVTKVDLGRDDSYFSLPSAEPHVVFAGVVTASVCLTAAAFTAICFAHWRDERREARKKEEAEAKSTRASSQQGFIVQQNHHQQMQAFGGHAPPFGPAPSTSSPVPPPLPPANPPPPFLPSSASQLRQQQRPLPQQPSNNPSNERSFMSDAESRVTDWVQSQHRRQQQQQMQQQQQQQHHPVDEQHLEEMSPEAVMEALEVDRLSLKLGQLLQEGTFGRVYQGTIESEDGAETDVVVKTVIAGSSEAQCRMLVREATALHGMNHSHVQTLLASTWDGTSPMLVYPHFSQSPSTSPSAAGGNLKKWLQQSTTRGHAGLSTHTLVSLGLQMLKAVQHLHKRRVIHKDIAARNCILCDGNHLKLCDSALSRDLFPSDYHCLGDNENRPIKWMAPESISRKRHSRASDVWSYGVFLWELMTRAQQPFSDVDPFEMEAYLRSDFRLHQPNNCPDRLYSVLASCWAARPQDRATVHQLYGQLQQLQRQLQQFV